MAEKILIDTDPGQDIDDLIAIHFALLRPELDVKAITAATMPSRLRARLVKRLLRLLGREEIPVAAGMELPMRPFSEKELAFQKDLSLSMNHYAFALPEDQRDEPDSLDAAGLIIKTVEESPGEITLACIAPLTNVAAALIRKPEIAGKIKAIAMMGGEIKLPQLEHNVAFDWMAADIVLSAGIPTYMGTWSVTRQFFLDDADCARLESGDAVCEEIAKAVKLWSLKARGGKPGPVMYDIFSMIWPFDKTLYAMERRSVAIETRAELLRGMTVRSGDASHIHVSEGIDAPGVKKLYFDTVLRRN
jgi:purine nucleosidase/pyrimidine-specific ribonucleoside hydrolase